MSTLILSYSTPKGKYMNKSESPNPEEDIPLLAPIYTSMFPFRNNNRDLIDGDYEYIITREDQIVLENTIGPSMNKSRLKAFFVQKCNVIDPTNYSFPEIIAALRFYIERSCGKDAGDKPPTSQDGATEGCPEEKKQSVPTKEPPKEAQQAYKLYYGGMTQEQVAKNMTNKLRKPVSQGQVSRWLKQYKKWRKAEGIPVDDKKANIITNSNILDIGARTDGRLTGDPRHKKNHDFDTGYNQ